MKSPLWKRMSALQFFFYIILDKHTHVESSVEKKKQKLRGIQCQILKLKWVEGDKEVFKHPSLQTQWQAVTTDLTQRHQCLWCRRHCHSGCLGYGCTVVDSGLSSWWPPAPSSWSVAPHAQFVDLSSCCTAHHWTQLKQNISQSYLNECCLLCRCVPV